MKRKIARIAMISVIAITVGWNFTKSAKNVPLSDLTLSNVEALAGENPDCPNGCLSNGSGCYCNGWYPYYKENS